MRVLVVVSVLAVASAHAAEAPRGAESMPAAHRPWCTAHAPTEPLAGVCRGSIGVVDPGARAAAARPVPGCSVPANDDTCEAWVARYDHSGGHGPAGLGFDVALDAAAHGDLVLVTGTSWDEARRAQDFATLAVRASDGSRVWAARTTSAPELLDIPYAIATDGARAYAAGVGSWDIGDSGDLLVVAYGVSDGVEQWRARADVAGRLDAAADVAVAPDGGRVFVTGRASLTATDIDYLTLALDAGTGAILWSARYGAGDFDQATRLAVSPDGLHVFATGVAQFGDDYDMATVSYDARTGAREWVARFAGVAGGLDIGTLVAVSPDGGSVFVAGDSGASGRAVLSGVTEYATVAYDASNGSARWTARYAGPVAGENIPFGMAISLDGARLFVTGQSTGDATAFDWDWGTIAYDAATGAVVWSDRFGVPNFCVEWGQAPIVDGDRLVVGGISSLDCLAVDYAAVEYDASTGARRWVARYNSGAIDYDSPIAGVAAQGKAILAGTFSHKFFDPTSMENLDDYGVVAYD